MIKITTQGEYGLRCVLNIARGENEPVTTEEICRKERLSSDYAEQLLMRLRRAGIVESQRGPGGGYLLAKRPNRIKIKEVIAALETNPFETICGKFTRKRIKCTNVDKCKVRHLWQKLSKTVEQALTKVSVADLL